jgi:hypothetical protein
MKFSFFMMPLHQPSESPALAFQRDIGFIHQADTLGYDEFMIGEHHSGGFEIIASPEVFIAAAAQRTKHIRLGTGVKSLPYHHPFVVAETMALTKEYEQQFNDGLITQGEKYNKVVDAWAKCTDRLADEMMKRITQLDTLRYTNEMESIILLIKKMEQ